MGVIPTSAVDRANNAKEELARRAGKTTRPPWEIPPRPKEGPEAAPETVAPRFSTNSAERKMFPLCTGFLDYFPDACMEVSNVSFLGNEKHNPGQPLHHARGKSMDHADCIARHLAERGGYDTIEVNGVAHKVRHSAALAWRAMALLQEELETEKGLPLPRAAK